MSYKHNNLMAMRLNYWNDDISPAVLNEKRFLQCLLQDQDVFSEPNMDDAKYLFFNLPSIIIVKGYAMGFQHEKVKTLIFKFVQDNKAQLQSKTELKIQYRM
jgi:hypothetical protein